MKRNFVQLFFITLQRSLKTTNVTSLVEFLFFLEKLFLLDIFNFTGYANYTTYDITAHNEYL